MWRILIFIFVIPAISLSQQISKRINLSVRTDHFDAITAIDTCLLLKTGNLVENGCVEDHNGLGHGAILKLDVFGNIIKQKKTIECDSSYFYTFGLSSNLFIANENKAIAVYGDYNLSGNIRILEYDYYLDTLIIHILKADDKILRPQTINQIGDHYFILINSERGMYEMWKLDANLEVVKREVVYDDILRDVKTTVYDDDNLLITLAVPLGSKECRIIFRKYNEELDMISTFEYENNITTHSNPTIYEVEDGGYISSWSIDYPERFDIIIHGIHGDTFRFQPTITKFNEEFEPEWEYFLMESHWTELLTFEYVGASKYLAVGGSEEYANIYPGDHPLDDVPQGYAFLINDEGELLWRRYITDLRSNTWRGHFWDGCAMPGGYALAGVIDTIKDVPDPYINDPAGWLVTLDENGCWNGNCNNYIMILDDSTSKTLKFDTVTSTLETVPQENIEFKVYPNPSSSVVTIEFENPKKRMIELINMEGRTLHRVESISPKAILQIGGFPPGMYVLRVRDQQGHVEGRQKVIVR